MTNPTPVAWMVDGRLCVSKPYCELLLKWKGDYVDVNRAIPSQWVPVFYSEAQLNQARADAIKECNEFWSKKSDVDNELIQKLHTDISKACAAALKEAAAQFFNGECFCNPHTVLIQMAAEIEGEKK